MPTDSPTPAPDNTPPKRTRSVQNQAISAYITDSLETLNAALGTPEIGEKLATRGFPAAAIQQGIALQAAALKAFNDQLPAIGASRTQTEQRQKRIAEAREDYTDFRGIARAAFPAQGDRIALGLSGDIPDDFGKFVTAAGTSYAAGKKAPHTEKLTLRGYPPTTLDTLTADLAKLTEPDLGEDDPAPEPAPAADDDMSDSQAVAAAYNALKDWMKEFKGVARVLFRKRPDLLLELGCRR